MTLPWTSCRVENAAAHIVGGGGGGGSGWGVHGSFLDLSTTVVANDTVTANAGGSASFSTVRGTQGHGAVGGKWYYEIKLLTAPGANALYIGLLDAHEVAANMNDTTPANGGATYCYDGTGVTQGTSIVSANIGTAVTLATNDVLGIAFDADNGFSYFSRNGTYFLSGAPTSGASGTGHITAYTGVAFGADYYPRVGIWGAVNAVVQLITTAPFTTAAPSGYSAWG